MLTANYLTENELSVNHVLTEDDKKEILKENKDNDNYSYLSLMKEMFYYRHITVQSLLQGWSGIQLVEIPKGYSKV